MSPSRRVDIDAEFDAPAHALWRLVSDFPHIDRWADLKVISTTGTGVGATRTVEMASGVRITERLVHADEAGLTMTYEAVEPNPFPMHEYRSTITIAPLSSLRCRLHWRGTYVPPDGSDPARADRLLQKVYEGGIALLREHLKRVPS